MNILNSNFNQLKSIKVFRLLSKTINSTLTINNTIILIKMIEIYLVLFKISTQINKTTSVSDHNWGRQAKTGLNIKRMIIILFWNKMKIMISLIFSKETLIKKKRSKNKYFILNYQKMLLNFKTLSKTIHFKQFHNKKFRMTYKWIENNKWFNLKI